MSIRLPEASAQLTKLLDEGTVKLKRGQVDFFLIRFKSMMKLRLLLLYYNVGWSGQENVV